MPQRGSEADLSERKLLWLDGGLLHDCTSQPQTCEQDNLKINYTRYKGYDDAMQSLGADIAQLLLVRKTAL